MLNKEIISLFSENGFAVINDFFSAYETEEIRKFVEVWFNKNISNAINSNSDKYFLNIQEFPKYHNFIIKNDIDHSKIAAAKYRYIDPPKEIIKIIHKKILFQYLELFSGFKSFMKWQDPGFGWLGYRLIRANSNDGYPPSCKNWGAANNVYSIWLPISGTNKKSNIRLLPGSHKKKFNKYLPKNSKFTKGEYRLDEEIPESDYIRPIVKTNGIIIFHPACIHSEDSADLINTRLNLEYRFKPIHES